MHINLSTPNGVIKVQLLHTEAPVACRCIQYQIQKGAWSKAVMELCPEGVKLVGSSFTPTLGSERPQTPFRGMVAFGKTTNELLIYTITSTSLPPATALGQVSLDDLAVLLTKSDVQRQTPRSY